MTTPARSWPQKLAIVFAWTLFVYFACYWLPGFALDVIGIGV